MYGNGMPEYNFSFWNINCEFNSTVVDGNETNGKRSFVKNLTNHTCGMMLNCFCGASKMWYLWLVTKIERPVFDDSKFFCSYFYNKSPFHVIIVIWLIFLPGEIHFRSKFNCDNFNLLKRTTRSFQSSQIQQQQWHMFLTGHLK